MSLREKLDIFAQELSLATSAPDEYPSWGYVTYEGNMNNLRSIWSEIKPLIKVDVEKVDIIEEKMNEIFSSFDSGDRVRGRDAVWEIYNMKVKNLR